MGQQLGNEMTKLTSNQLFLQSTLRGIKERCPQCGKGDIFRKYLKVNDKCTKCEQPLDHYPADDAPPYLTILIVGHIVVPLVLYWSQKYDLSIEFAIGLGIVGIILLSLLLLQRIKGVVIGVLWTLEKLNSSTAD